MQTGALIAMKEARKYLTLLRINFKQKFLIEIIILIHGIKDNFHIT